MKLVYEEVGIVVPGAQTPSIELDWKTYPFWQMGCSRGLLLRWYFSICDWAL